MGCPNKVNHVTYCMAQSAVSCKAWRSIVSQTSGLMKENGKGGKGQESSGKRPGWLWFRCNRTGQLRVGNHVTVKAFEYEGMERLANLRSNWIKEGPQVNVVLTAQPHTVQYCYSLYSSHTVPVASYSTSS